MPFVDIHGSSFYYEESGKGEQVIFCAHAFLFNSTMYDNLIKLLGTDYRFIAYDHHFHGRTISHSTKTNFETWVEEIALLVKTLAPGKSVTFIGSSLGGIVGVALAVKFPDLVSRLILLGAPLKNETFIESIPIRLFKFFLPIIGFKPFIKGLTLQYFGKSFRNDPMNEAEISYWMRTAMENSTRDIPLMISAMLKRNDYSKGIDKIGQVCIIYGDEDSAVSRDRIKSLSAQINRNVLHVLEGVGHLPAIEQPHLVAPLIQSFLKASN